MGSFSSLWTDTVTTLDKVVWSIFIGIVIASLMLWYNRRVVGAVVRVLNRDRIHSPQKAKTLGEMGLNNRFIRNALKRSDSVLRKTVYTECTKKKLTEKDFDEVKFYIPEELRHKSHYKYLSNNTTLPIILIFIVVMFILALLCIKYIPELLDMIPESWRGK